jgi:tetratricopeptide (TPR) repeat protein
MTALDIPSTLQTALVHHSAGRLAEAERLYRQILAVVPEQPDALHHLGVIALQCGKGDLAVQIIGRAVELAPNAAAFNNLGAAWRKLGRLPEAIECYKKSLALDGRQVDAITNLGLTFYVQKRYADAEPPLRQALSLAPNHAAALSGLANVLLMQERFDESAEMFERAHRTTPRDFTLSRAAGDAWLKAGDPYRAITAARKAIEIEPADAMSYGILSQACEALNKTDQSIASAHKAVEVGPTVWQAHHNLAGILQRAGKPDEALAPLQTALRLNPRESGLYGSLASALLADGKVAESIDAANRGLAIDPKNQKLYGALWASRYAASDFAGATIAARRAVELDPQNVESHAHLAFGLLAHGDFEEGFQQYEWRWRDPKCTTKPRDFTQPLWDGSDPANRRVMLHSEQGFGDIFMFLRFAPLVRKLGATVLIEVNYKLAGLVRRMCPDATVCIAGTMLPDFEMHAPLASLPAIFGTSRQTLPCTVPYFTADPALAAQWRLKMEPSEGLLVGIVWAGNAKPDPKRSATLADFAPLATVPSITLISLQPKPESDEANNLPPGMKLINLGPDLRDFSDTTASVLANLDLLITVDTGVAHLAGAMGVPTWLLLRESPEWRWAINRDTSVWYPTFRLFRQSKRGDWGSVMAVVAGELRKLAKA